MSFCIVCHEQPRRVYKCRFCEQVYCSAVCSKKHREVDFGVTDSLKEEIANQLGISLNISDVDPTELPNSLNITELCAVLLQQKLKEIDAFTAEGSSDIIAEVLAKRGCVPAKSYLEKHQKKANLPTLKRVRPSSSTPSQRVDEPTAQISDTEATGSAPPTDPYLLREQDIENFYTNKRLRSTIQSAELQSLIRLIDRSKSKLDALDAAQANDPQFKAFCDELLNDIWKSR